MYFGKAKDVVGDLRSKSSCIHMLIQLGNRCIGIPPMTETNREKASHREMIDSMKR